MKTAAGDMAGEHHPAAVLCHGLIKSKNRDSVASTIRKAGPPGSVRRVFGYLRMLENSRPRTLNLAMQVE